MLITDKRPALYCEKLKVDNLSPNGNVFFLDENHIYYHKDDIINGKAVSHEKSKYRFRSPTGLIKEFYKEFDTIPIAKRYVIKHELDISYKELIAEWDEKGRVASEEGTLLHGFAESLWNNWRMKKPDSPKAEYVIELMKELQSKYKFIKTELLTYSLILKLAGQVDLLLKNKEGYHLMDYKFIKADLEKKSYYNFRTKRYRMMFGPFRFLYDTEFYHYSLQMELYRYLMGAKGKQVVSKTLIVVTPEEYNFIPGYKMRVWVNKAGYLHAEYKHPYTKKMYNSSKDPIYCRDKFKLIEV